MVTRRNIIILLRWLEWKTNKNFILKTDQCISDSYNCGLYNSALSLHYSLLSSQTKRVLFFLFFCVSSLFYSQISLAPGAYCMSLSTQLTFSCHLQPDSSRRMALKTMALGVCEGWFGPELKSKKTTCYSICSWRRNNPIMTRLSKPTSNVSLQQRESNY